MVEKILKSLRDQLLDESEPLAGLLRKTLMLGAETGSIALREWASKELKGYNLNEEVPDYRRIPLPPIQGTRTAGYSYAKNVKINVFEFPERVAKEFPAYWNILNPIEEIERLSQEKTVFLANSGLGAAEALYNQENAPFRSLLNCNFVLSGITYHGVIGQIRTRLVEVVADLTSGDPMETFPKKNDVDAAVFHRVGTIYNTNINSMSGAMAIGNNSSANSYNLRDLVAELSDLKNLVDQETGHEGLDSLSREIQSLRDDILSEDCEKNEIEERVERLDSISKKIGLESIKAAVAGVCGQIARMVAEGAFG